MSGKDPVIFGFFSLFSKKEALFLVLSLLLNKQTVIHSKNWVMDKLETIYFSCGFHRNSTEI